MGLFILPLNLSPSAGPWLVPPWLVFSPIVSCSVGSAVTSVATNFTLSAGLLVRGKVGIGGHVGHEFTFWVKMAKPEGS